MKKMLAIFMATILSFSLTACNNKESEETTSTTTTYEDPYDIDIYKSEDLDLEGNIIGATDAENTDATDVKRLPDVIMHFIDVGQADCTLIQTPKGKNILIDGGNKSDAEDLVKYLTYLKIEKIDVLIATHPHEDHIGGLPLVINQFDIGEIYMPYVPEQYTPTTQIYEKLLLSIAEKDLSISECDEGKKILSEDNLEFSCLYNGELGSDDYNTYSIVTMLEYGDHKAIFTGDADTIVENKILSNYGGPWYEFEKDKSEIDCDILKVGHHGSYTANSLDWLKTLTPQYAIIPCETGNSYGHPHDVTINNLTQVEAEIYNMAEKGTIVIRSDGKEISVSDKCTGDYPLGNENYDDTIILPYTP